MFHENSSRLELIDRIVMEYHDVTRVNSSYIGEEMEGFLEGDGFSVHRRPSQRHPNYGILHASRVA